MSELAIQNGTAVRTGPFHTSVVISEEESELIKEVVDSQEFSRFMGSPSVDVLKHLEMPSIHAREISGHYFTFLGGTMVRRFEADFAQKFGSDFAVSVNSATSGLSMALGAIGAGPGDEIITTCMSFNATAASILVFNSIPVFVDVDSETFCLSPSKIEKAITPKTKAIIVVHLLGVAANMDAIMEIAQRNKLFVIEDCAQAPGTVYKERLVGTIGDIGVFSLQETKNIQTGEGGMAITNDAALAKKMRLIRNHGESIATDDWSEEELENIIGMNYRMTELTAALGVAQLRKLDKNNSVRRENALYLAERLAKIPGLTVPEYAVGVIPHVFALKYDSAATGVDRAKVLAALRAEGIPVGSGYLRLMYENPIFLKRMAYGKKGCPWSCQQYGSERVYQKGDCPVGEGLLYNEFIWFYHIHRPNTLEDMQDVIEAFYKVFKNMDTLKNSSIDTTIGYKW